MVMSKVIIIGGMLIVIILWACLKVASDADDEMERWYEEDGK
jgi:hypothetical protein